jgi:hypothetical protein
VQDIIHTVKQQPIANGVVIPPPGIRLPPSWTIFLIKTSDVSVIELVASIRVDAIKILFIFDIYY